MWTKDERTWLEIPASLLDKPFFFGSSRASGLGERFFVPGLMGRPQVVVLRKVGNTVQLMARNLHARAPAGTPLARAVAESYSESLLASAPLAAAPQPQNQALLVDAAAPLGGDLTNNQTSLEFAYRLPYALDRANTQVERARAGTAGTYITVRQHHSVARLPAPPATPPASLAALPAPPTGVPDARSLFLSQSYTLAPLPAEPMKTRGVDPRVGYFQQSYIDFGNDAQEGRRTHIINRWRLEKKDPAAAVSEPKQPIRAVLDRNIPEKWRAPLRDGVLEWSKAFERAGFRNAIVVEQQADNADWSTLEGTRVLAIRWYAQNGPGSTAIGLSQVDSRTGEILRGAALIDENRVRVGRARLTEVLPRLEGATADARPGDFARRFGAEDVCEHAEVAFDQLDTLLELLALRGDIDPNGPDAERYIAASLKDVTMHEVGHALGLRHNFRASASVTLAQLRDPAFVQANGLSPSIMDYNGSNAPLDGEPVAPAFMGTLGAYDYWAIEVGYREWPDADSERKGRAALLARADTDPLLAYGTDGDLGVGDPLINQRDMGDDPVAWAERSLRIGRELLARVSARPLPPEDDFTLYRRTLNRVFGTLGTALPIAAKVLGGVSTERTVSGSGKALVTPVPAARQRAALELILRESMDSKAFRFDPKLMSRLGVDRAEGEANADFSVATQAMGLQRGVLDALIGDTLAQRLADAESKVADARTLLSFAEVQERLSAAVWSELGARGGALAVDSLRRNLQREHVRRRARARRRWCVRTSTTAWPS